MLLTVYCVRRDLSEVTFSLQVDADFELHNFRALCELESGIPAAESQIVYAERPLTDNHRSLASYGLKDGDVVILRQKENADPRPSMQFPSLPRIDFRSITVPGTSSSRQRQPPRAQPSHSPPGDIASSPQGLDNPALLRDMLLANPHELSLLKERNPPLADALLSGDLEKFSRVLVEQQQDRARREQERIRLFSADPFDLEAQAKIEEDIRQQNIEENMTIAMEEAPESFGQVVMLYINCKVNGHPVKAFVDSGAQMTIMSQACAERCNIMRLVDRRWAGIAKGVGTQKIIGRVHLAQVQIEGDFLACSFSILEEQPMDMLLGLDMLKRHQCSIDLKKNVLVIGTTGSQTTFLPEGELPECARLAYGAGREEVRPEEIADRELAEALQKSVQDAENSGEETTSLGTSPSPTSSGFDHPARPSGRSPEIGDPAGLAGPVSASAAPVAPSDPGSVGPEAAEPSKAAARPQTTSGEQERLPLQGLPDRAASADRPPADRCPAVPVWSPPGEATVADDPEKPPAERSTPGPTGQEVSVTATGMQEPQRLLGEEGWHPGCQSLQARNGSREAVRQSVPDDREHACAIGDLDLPGEGQLSQPEGVAMDAAREGGGPQQRVALLGSQPGGPPSGCVGCSHSETLMEVDASEQSLVAGLRSAGGQGARGRDPCASDLTSPAPLMEVDASQCSPSSEILSNSVSTQSSELPERNVETSGTNEDCGGCSPSLRLCGSGRPSVEAAEESCPSLSAALKELHGLLVTNSKPASESSSEEVVHQSETVTERQAGLGVLSERRIRSAHRTAGQSGQCSHVSFRQAVSVSVKTGRLADVAAGAGIEDAENPGFGGQGDSPLTDEGGVAESREPAPAETLNQPHCTLGVEVPPKLFAGEEEAPKQALEPTKSLSSDFMLVRDLGRGTRDTGTGGPETRDGVLPEAARPLLELEPLTSSPPPRPSVLPLSPFPAADIDRILRAGFTLQEALGALQQGGGNADLALLILLAKNIVVPT